MQATTSHSHSQSNHSICAPRIASFGPNIAPSLLSVDHIDVCLASHMLRALLTLPLFIVCAFNVLEVRNNKAVYRAVYTRYAVRRKLMLNQSEDEDSKVRDA
ncbi:hypothetical protein BT96DRAFT_135643 [Gymnopus androsaceus JB14]|uniref:Uncharacterized protein n=1 Tax=Gymnopus androsaceus JB14 TaxID=1447944 RepID=A0A6A4HDV9_9AGAR|nr:hypothetical protein BT96DRAFT_135643 [Gymnopus androsaceus JB14]